MKGSIVLIALLLLATIPAMANEEDGPGIIRGKVTTTDGNPAAYVTIKLKNTKKSVITDEQGSFIIRNVLPGQYELEVSLVGFETITQAVTIDKERSVTVSLQLAVSDKQLQEVVVVGGRSNYKINTASSSLRLTTPLNKLPQNIQVVSRQLLVDQQIFDMLEGVSRNVSGVTKLEHWDNYARLNMRGSRIAPFRNGMNVESTWGPLAEDMSMVERIEFVKGPAGFMMSNGEPSGFYNVVTKKPTGQTKGEVAFTLGSFDTYRATLDLDGKLSKDGKLLYRFNVMGQEKGSHRDFEFNNRYTIAPVLKYQFNEQTSLTAEYTYQYSKMSMIGSSYVFSPKKYADAPRNFTNAEPNLDPTVIKDHSAYLILEHKLNDQWKLTGQLAYFKYDQVGSSMWADSVKANGDVYRNVGIWDAANESKFGQFFLNGEVLTGAVSHHILAGLDLGNKRYMADWNTTLPLNGTEPFNIYHPVHNVPMGSLPVFDRSKSLRYRAGANILSQSFTGVYVQDELHFWDDKVRLTLAGRWTHAKDSEYGTATDETKFTPRAGISVSIDKETSVYALYDQAFVPQSGVDFSGKSFDPITGNNIEGGLKRDWFNGRWNSTISVYQITKNNVLTADPEHINFSKQLGQTKTKGVEIDVKGELLRGLNLVVNYAFTESVVTKDTDPKKVNIPVPGTTKHVQNAWLSYRLQQGVLQGIGVSVGYQWQLDRSSWFVFDGTEQSLPDYFRMDGALSWQHNRFGVALNVNNLLDKYLFSGSPLWRLLLLANRSTPELPVNNRL